MMWVAADKPIHFMGDRRTTIHLARAVSCTA